MNIDRFALVALAGLAIACGSAEAQVKIAQHYGGNTTAVGTGNYQFDYVILKNTSNAPIDMSTWSIQYAATTGSTWSRTNLSGVIPANGYFLIQCQGSASGTPLPISADVSSTTINMSATAGKLALIRSQTTITTGTVCATGDPNIEDFLGYSPATTCSEGTPTIAGTATTALFRHMGGCFDTGNNIVDFANRTPTAADFFNASSPTSACVADAVNLSVGITASVGTCEVTPGPAATTFTVTVNDLGGTVSATGVTANITLPAQFTYTAASGSPSQGSITPGAGTISWDVGTLSSGSSATLTYQVDVAGTGGPTTSVAVSSTEAEAFAANNSASITVPIMPATFPLHSVFLGNHASLPASKREISPPSGGTRTWATGLTSGSEVFGRFYGSADGNNFVFVGTLDSTTATNNVAIMKGSISGPTVTLTPVIQKGTTELTPGETVGATIDNGVGINDTGQIAFSGISSAGANNDYVARRNADGTMTVIVRENGAFPGTGPATIGANNNYTTGLTNDGRVVVESIVAGGDTTGTTNDIIMILSDGTSSTVIGREATAPAVSAGSIPSGEGGTWKAFDSGSVAGAEAGTYITGDAAHTMLSGTVNTVTGTTTDNVLVRDGVIMIQEGKMMTAPEPFAGGITASTFNHGYMMDHQGNWICYGSNSVAGADWVVRNGTAVARTGDEIVSGSGEHWSDSAPINPGAAGYADTYFSVTNQGSDYVVVGITDAPYGYRNAAAVWNGTQVIVREGDPIDLDGNGIADDNCFVNIFRNGRMWISSQRVLYLPVSTRSGNCAPITESGNCVLAIQLPAVGNGGCQPADIAADDGTPLPCDTNVHPNNGVNEGDYNAFFQGFFNAAAYCDQWDDAGNPLPSAGSNNGVNEGDYNGFFQTFFNGCP